MKNTKNTIVLSFVVAWLSLGVVADADIDAVRNRGAAFLLARQHLDGHFSDPQMPALTALPLWALCSCSNVPSRALDRAAAFMLNTQRADGGFYVPKPGRGGSGLGNYNTSVCLSALFEARRGPDAALLKAREYLAASQLSGDDTLAGGFGYDKISRRRYADLSNTSYALDALARTSSLEERRTGGRRVDIDWDRAIAFVGNLQSKSGPDKGGSTYNSRTAQAGGSTNAAGRVHLRAYGSMSYAAVLSMCSARLTKNDPRVRNALEYCTKNWTLDENPGMGNQGLYYYYDILARALSAAGVDELRRSDGSSVAWKRELAARLIALQKKDGGWANDNNRFWESDGVLATSFAMLALGLCR